MTYSVLMSVYKNETVENFEKSIKSLLNQTVMPCQIVLVRDGAVYEKLQSSIDKYVSEYPDLFTYLPLSENGGLGNALKYGLPYCKCELVARMDTDDICVPDRFERQLDFIRNNPDVDVVGGNISEFSTEPDEIIDYRTVPEAHEEIIEYLKTRSPFNHVTVMFRKSAVLNVGSYEDIYLLEDWHLWVKLCLSGSKFANINAVLVNVRISDMSNRRGGFKYYQSCKKLLRFMKDNGLISFGKYIKSCLARFFGHVLLPNKIRAWAYKKFLRNSQNLKESKTGEKITEEV